MKLKTSFLILFIVACLSIVLSVSAAEHPLVKELKQLTSNCDKKNPLEWLDQLNQLEHHLYEQAYIMSKDEFQRHFLGETNNVDDKGELYWLYMLYGAPYIKIQEGNSLLADLASSCFIYLYDFEKSLAKLDYKTADADMSSWQSCLWTWSHKFQPAANSFQACYRAIPKEEEGRSRFVISPVEVQTLGDEEHYSLPARQRVELYVRDSKKLETVTISTVEDLNEDSKLYDWVVRSSDRTRISKPSDDHQLYLIYQGKVIFSTHDIVHQYIHFNGVCTGSDKRQKLLFSMVMGGSANGELQDMLFVYYDPVSKAFKHKIIERRYLPELCDMEGAKANKAEQEKQLKAINAIHKKIRPSLEDTELTPYLVSHKKLPVRQLSKAQLDALIADLKQFMPTEIEGETDNREGDVVEDDYYDYYEPQIYVGDLAQNSRWRIMEVLYLQLYSSWGVLLAENKKTGVWTAFYNASGGDSNNFLYLDDDVELVGDKLRGKFEAYTDYEIDILLGSFTVQKTSGYRFSDYPVEAVYAGSIAKLDTKSSETAQTFPTRIRSQLEDGVNFSGHYSLMMAGCGTECQVIVLTDVITGMVVAEIHARSGVEYKADSQLLVINAADTICVLDGRCEQSYYQMVSGELKQLGLD